MKEIKLNKSYETASHLVDDFCSKNEARWYLEPLMEIAKNCNSVLEYGTWQGQSLAAFIAAGVGYITSRDIDLSRINKNLFFDLADERGVNIIIEAGDSLVQDSLHFDMIFFDTAHTYQHVKKELETNGLNATRYIAVHDTNYPKNSDKKVRHAVEEFAEANGFKVVVDINECTGLMVIENV